MVNYPVKYTHEFSWVKLTPNGDYQCGITDIGQQVIGKIIYIELPAIGDSVIQEQPCAVLESRKSIIDIIAPLTGKIIQTNQQLLLNPDLVNTSPYQDGWLFYIAKSDDSQLQWMQLLENEPGVQTKTQTN